MTTIEIVKELNSADANYLAIHGKQQSVGITPGQTLDALENLLAEEQSPEEVFLSNHAAFSPR